MLTIKMVVCLNVILKIRMILAQFVKLFEQINKMLAQLVNIILKNIVFVI